MSKPSKRILGSQADLQGDRINGLIIGDYVSRTPLRWATTCERCKSQSVHPHALLMNGGARCLNSGCGKDNLREYANDTPGKAREREKSAENARRRKIEEKKAADFAELETGLKETARRLGIETRKAIQAGHDSELYVDPTTIGIVMTQADADAFNIKEAEKFAQSPEFQSHRNSKTVDAIANYMEAHGVRIVSQSTLQKAFVRLRDYGLLEQNPAPIESVEPITVEHVEPTPPPSAIVRKEIGLDLNTGEQREYTPWEVNRMSGDEYRRIFRPVNTLPNRALF